MEKRAAFEKIIVKIFRILGISLFVILSFCSLIMTGENRDLSDEFIYETPDSLVGNIFWICVALLCIYIVYHIILRYGNRWGIQFAAGVSILITLVCIYWVGASSTVPQADQFAICRYADAFNSGDYSSLARGEYVGIYPQQLGLITLARVLFFFFGAGNYRAFQYFSALMAGALVFFGYQVVRHLSNCMKTAEIYYLLFAVFCVPLYIYVPFVYGEIISTSLLMMAAWILLSCLESFSWGKVIVLGLASGLAVQMRENSLIVLIGFLIVLMIKMITGNTRTAAALMLSMLAGTLLFFSIITYGIYGDKIPEDSESMPAILHIAMGLNWNEVNPGWYDRSNLAIFRDNNCSVEASKEDAMELVREFMETARDNDGYAADFFTHKLTSQWAAPMYQCLAMNNKIEGEQSRLAHSVYFGRLRILFQKFMNIYQLLVYGSVLLVLFAKQKEWVCLEKYILLIGIFGGFLFSLMWEAKTRYVFPYFLFMIPYAVVGLGSLDFKKLTKRDITFC